MATWVDVGVFGEGQGEAASSDAVLLLEKQKMTTGQTTLQLVVTERPVRAGIDPYNKLIERNRDDNVVDVVWPEG